MTIDVNIEDYSKETLSRFALLFASVPSEQLQLQAMNIVQQAFESDKKSKEFEFFAMSTMIRQKLLQLTKEEEEKKECDPIIQPTDLI